MKTYTEKRFFEWHEDDISVTLRNMSGSYGGGSEVLIVSEKHVSFPMIVDTLAFDESQITSPTNGNHPRWGGMPPYYRRSRKSNSGNQV